VVFLHLPFSLVSFNDSFCNTPVFGAGWSFYFSLYCVKKTRFERGRYWVFARFVLLNAPLLFPDLNTTGVESEGLIPRRSSNSLTFSLF
jgi:hypothetical protein